MKVVTLVCLCRTHLFARPPLMCKTHPITPPNCLYDPTTQERYYRPIGTILGLLTSIIAVPFLPFGTGVGAYALQCEAGPLDAAWVGCTCLVRLCVLCELHPTSWPVSFGGVFTPSTHRPTTNTRHARTNTTRNRALDYTLCDHHGEEKVVE